MDANDGVKAELDSIWGDYKSITRSLREEIQRLGSLLSERGENEAVQARYYVCDARPVVKMTKAPRPQLVNSCPFCRSNGETKQFYSSHSLKDPKGKVICPILRAYVCPMCGTSGDDAHTLKYCPFNKGSNGSISIGQMKFMQKHQQGLRNSTGKQSLLRR